MQLTSLFDRRDTLIAVGAATASWLLYSLGSYTHTGRLLPAIPTTFLIGTLLLMGLAMLFRRTVPVLCLGIGTVAFVADIAIGPSLGTVLMFTDVLYAATVYGPRRMFQVLLSLSAAVTIVAAAVMLILERRFDVAILIPVQLGLVLVVPVFTGFDIRRHREQARDERLRADQLARLAELDRKAAVTAERTRMARELHDVIANHLSAISIQSTAGLSVPGLDQDAVRELLTVIRQSSNAGLAEMKEMIYLLRDDSDGEPSATPRIDDVQRLIDQANASGAEATLKVEGAVRPLPVAVDLAAYRIVQESLTNVVKHAGGAATVCIDYRPESVLITVDSPLGGGSSRVQGSGSGLVGMAERAEMLGGEFQAGPEDRQWRVRAELPVR
ncbi:sensor histidine kinase [Fodinicola acaciae]|uniref:sensor histidine kinase n=1 Tax=Fodinicola acaciae TaxID=2681555 RepID=UPI0013D693BD|nr:histidine kinase [Fodinicola acaciae]